MSPWDHPTTTSPPVSNLPKSHDAADDITSWDERIARAQSEAETLTREIAWLRAERERVYQEKQEQALARKREKAQQERERGAAGLAAEAEASATAPQQTRLVEDAIVRYAVACATVDVQIALLRARGGSGGGNAPSDRSEQSETLRRLADALYEQSDASALLRRLAHDIQQARGGDHFNEKSSFI